MTTLSYGDKLKDPRWQKLRLDVFNRDSFTCRSCNDSKTELNVHHLKYTGFPWQAPIEDLITLCRHCHSCIELVKGDYVFNGYGFKVVRDNIIFLTIPEGDAIHLFTIKHRLPNYLVSLASNILKDMIHHTINWWLATEQEHNLNLYIKPIQSEKLCQGPGK